MHAEHPLTMTTLSTHDTKRADDVRARLAVLTEIPSRWRGVLHRWSRKNRPFKTNEFPDRNTEYFLYQTLIGAWPIAKDRVNSYMEKAVREAKQQTSWIQQNKEFEDALKLFIDRIFDSTEFVSELDGFVAQILLPGRINGLTQTLLKCAAPGVPDAYQGERQRAFVAFCAAWIPMIAAWRTLRSGRSDCCKRNCKPEICRLTEIREAHGQRNAETVDYSSSLDHTPATSRMVR